MAHVCRYGHIGLSVPNVEAACERFESLGVPFVKRPNDGKMKGLAFIQDPDGYWWVHRPDAFSNSTVASHPCAYIISLILFFDCRIEILNSKHSGEAFG